MEGDKGMWVVYVSTDKGWSEDERFDTEEDAIVYKKELLEEHPCINEDQFKVEESNGKNISKIICR